jgi:hypothetical protein
MSRFFTLALALAGVALLTQATQAQVFYPPQPIPLGPSVYPPSPYPPSVVFPNQTGGITVLNPDRVTNPWTNLALPGTMQNVQQFDPFTGRMTSGQTWIGADGRPHGNLQTLNPDGSVHMNVYGARKPGGTTNQPARSPMPIRTTPGFVPRNR